MIDVRARLACGAFALDVAVRSDAPVLGVFGPSGAGKSTLLAIVAGLVRPDAGHVTVDGRALLDTERGVDVPVHRRGVGMVFQDGRLLPHYSVTGNLLYGARGRRERLEEVIDLLELGPLRDRPVRALSGGERQRTAIGRALLADPRLLLLDEPLASLDRRLRRQVLPFLRRVHAATGTPMVVVSHELEELLQLTDELVVLDRGGVAGQGAFASLVHETPVLDVVHERGLARVLRGRVQERRLEDGIARVALGEDDAAPVLVVPASSAGAGASITVAIRPEDVALAREPVDGTSIRNQLPAVVRRRTDHGGGVLVEADLGGPTLLVEVSRGSAAALGLEPGRPITCLLKSHAVRVLDAGPPPAADPSEVGS